MAKGVIYLVLSLRPANLARLDGVGLIWGFACALVLSLFAGALVALAPAITTTRRNLKSGFRTAAGAHRVERRYAECAGGSWSPNLRSHSFCWLERHC